MFDVTSHMFPMLLVFKPAENPLRSGGNARSSGITTNIAAIFKGPTEKDARSLGDQPSETRRTRLRYIVGYDWRILGDNKLHKLQQELSNLDTRTS
ncbi:hypothetical protein RIB2604_00102560 [Aspergillus luchuensis]|uniref:Uncharacterized protein n=1 Tax=Aspergillus kawachii TaxID=1069201 RepID=A0A146EXP5_ASPKA|nr:hypothetical protein RIB2604_00102560 [Aspergillus luchuensis]